MRLWTLKLETETSSFSVRHETETETFQISQRPSETFQISQRPRPFKSTSRDRLYRDRDFRTEYRDYTMVSIESLVTTMGCATGWCGVQCTPLLEPVENRGTTQYKFGSSTWMEILFSISFATRSNVSQSQNVTSGDIEKTFSARSVRRIVLYPTLKMVAKPLVTGQ